MIEKLLRRFVSDEIEMVLKAIEKWAEFDTGCFGNVVRDNMIEDAVRTATPLESAVIRRVRDRCDKTVMDRMRKARYTGAAAKILLSNSFEEIRESVRSVSQSTIKTGSGGSIIGTGALFPAAWSDAVMDVYTAKKVVSRDPNTGTSITS